MKLEQQVCSLEFAQKLRKLGVKQKSYFYYTPIISSMWDEKEQAHVRKTTYMLSCQIAINEYSVSAFTVAELGEMLPQGAASFKRDIGIEWQCLPGRTLHNKAPSINADTEANACAKMLIYLLEHTLISL